MPTPLHAKGLQRHSKKKKGTPMLPTLIYLLKYLRRAMNKSGRGMFIVADSFQEAMSDWRAAKRKYPFAE